MNQNDHIDEYNDAGDVGDQLKSWGGVMLKVCQLHIALSQNILPRLKSVNSISYIKRYRNFMK